MGSGSSALIWYFACTIVVAFFTICASALIVIGRRSDNRKRAARDAQLARESDTGRGPD
ncbi:MAG: hypothetical protein KC593_20900 [Myxococcales bacterium]|nr:hypothetical protein [Myxococcales bacterium]MCB9626608.1 hypothetical protein [Sandaracinaceae bacterium]